MRFEPSITPPPGPFRGEALARHLGPSSTPRPGGALPELPPPPHPLAMPSAMAGAAALGGVGAIAAISALWLLTDRASWLLVLLALTA